MNTVAQLAAPLYDGGYRLPRVRQRTVNTVRQPAYPLYEWGGMHGLGQTAAEGPTLLKASAPILATATTAILTPVFAAGATAGGAGAGAAAGSLAGPIGTGVGILVGVIAGLWAAHAARVKGATAENQAINSAVQAWDAGMKAIFAAANSSDPTQNVSGSQAASQVQQLFSQFWAQMSPYMHAPGTADASMGGTNCGNGQLMPGNPCSGTPGGHPCGSSCTATCCVGCADLYPSMLQALQVLNSPSGGSVQVCTVYGSKYGAQQRSGYTLTYTPPVIAGGAVGAGISSITSDLSTLFGGSAASGGGSLLPLLAVGALAFFLLR
jgi:hypothetical protein